MSFERHRRLLQPFHDHHLEILSTADVYVAFVQNNCISVPLKGPNLGLIQGSVGPLDRPQQGNQWPNHCRLALTHSNDRNPSEAHDQADRGHHVSQKSIMEQAEIVPRSPE